MMEARGHVWLVGAGPGDPGLITLAAVRALGAADLVLYDALVNPALLDHVGPGAEKRFVGKRAGAHAMTQAAIEAALVSAAREGKRVVRLKGGDPFVFGRGGEEALACVAAGIPFTVVPGISSAIAGLAYAGIPLTHRGLSNSAFIATGAAGSEAGPVDWTAAATAGTVVVLMGAARIEETCANLLTAGMAPSTPAAVVASATLPGQRVVRATLGELAAAARAADPGSPALIVAGAAVALAEQLAWFAPGPLAGHRVAVTRSEEHGGDLAAQLESLGATILRTPTIAISYEAPGLTTDERAGSRWDWAVFTSGNGVEGFFRALAAAGKDARALGSTQVAAIGPSTAAALLRYGIRADFVPTLANSKCLAAELPRVGGARILLACGNLTDHRLADGLRTRKAHVERVEVYRTSFATLSEDAAAEVITADAITFASPSAAQALAAGLAGRALQAATKLISIGPRTSDGVRAHLGRVDAEAREPSAAALCDAVVEALS